MHIADGSPKYSSPARARSENPQEVWDAFTSSWVGVFGAPKCLHLDEGGEWENDLWRDLRAGRRIKLVFQGAGAHRWILERSNGLARGIHNRLKEGRLLYGPANPFRGAVALERPGFSKWIFGLPIGFWIQSHGLLWMG